MHTKTAVGQRWLVLSSLAIADPSIIQQAIEKVRERHDDIAMVPLGHVLGAGMFVISASDLAASLLQTQTTIDALKPLPSQMCTYEIRLKSSIKQVGSFVRDLKMLLQEWLMFDDVTNWAQHPNRTITVKSSTRAARALSNMTGVVSVRKINP